MWKSEVPNGYFPQFHRSRKDISAVIPNKSMGYYSQYLEKGGILCSTSGYPEIKSL